MRAAGRLWTVSALVVGAAVLSATPVGAHPTGAGLARATRLDTPAPTASVISPDAGSQAGGQTVTITGTGFVPGATTVSFNETPAADVTVSADGRSLTAVTRPASIGPVMVVVTSAGRSTRPLIYVYLADGSEAAAATVSPPSGPTTGGTAVTVTGTGLTGAMGVYFDGRPASGFTVDPGGTVITVVAPPHRAGPVRLELRFPEGRRDVGTFTYLAAAPPTIHLISPSQGGISGGTLVTVTGGGFQPGGTTVTICGRSSPAADVTVDPDGTSLTLRAPACAAGDTTVMVATAGGVSNRVTFRYADPILPVTGGPPSGGAMALGIASLGAGALGLGVLLVLLARLRACTSWRMLRP